MHECPLQSWERPLSIGLGMQPSQVRVVGLQPLSPEHFECRFHVAIRSIEQLETYWEKVVKPVVPLRAGVHVTRPFGSEDPVGVCDWLRQEGLYVERLDPVVTDAYLLEFHRHHLREPYRPAWNLAAAALEQLLSHHLLRQSWHELDDLLAQFEQVADRLRRLASLQSYPLEGQLFDDLEVPF